MLKEGDKLPKFLVASDKEGTVKSTDWLGSRVVLFFYPKDATSG
jgi:peroxiredoxin